MRFLVVALVGLFFVVQFVPICSAEDARRVRKPKPDVSATPIEIPKPKQAVTRTRRPKPEPDVSATPIEIPKPKQGVQPNRKLTPEND